MIFDIMQLCGGIILAGGWIPQVIQIIKTKSVRDLNLKTFVFAFVGIFLMELYAINLMFNGSGHMFLITNTIALSMQGLMCGLIILYKQK